MKFSVLTLFPESIQPYLGASILGRAEQKHLIAYHLINIRDFALDKHQTVDDTPYGGGPGMVLKIEPIAKALDSLTSPPLAPPLSRKGRRTVMLSAGGQQFTQVKAGEYAQLDELVLIAGRYEGVDQRVADHLADEEISIGPYVLAGGEIAAMAVIEATARLIPGVLGNKESLAEESYATNPLPAPPLSRRGPSLEYPHYTKPETYNGWQVPEVLLSGNHEAIKKWREQQRRTSNP